METIREQENILTVSELTVRIKKLLEARFFTVAVAGEISNLRRPASGHLYFTLQDSGSSLPAVCFRENARRLEMKPEDGVEVTARGRITVYRPRGSYQLVVAGMELKGMGSLQLAREKLKARLAAEGLFDPSRKKKLPPLPSRVGVVTSPSGAAIRDILQVIDRRFGAIGIVVNPVPVQGAAAAGEIARAVEEFNRWRNVEVIIVGRGGGSAEDLQPFNEESVARAIAASRIPVISAVGHEIDWTLADLAADLRAPTPSAAAELVIAEKRELLTNLNRLSRRLDLALNYLLGGLRSRVERALRSATLHDPKRLLGQSRQQLDELISRLDRLMENRLRFARQNIQSLTRRLESLNPDSVLARGYSFTWRLADGKIVTSTSMLEIGEEVRVRLREGEFDSTVNRID
ncbi:MAG: exodeoxyribonuclease VII large subunit [Candidatus Erginobacter occultus]|nr:exodeoxyribonuclease VII large subunit [Candidatus Erginobacter occultus]